jgi:hypothetical protein
MLREYGVKAEFTMYQESPLRYGLDAYWSNSDFHIKIDTLRALLLDFDTIDDFSVSLTPRVFVTSWEYLSVRDIEMTQWLWINAALVIHGMELVKLRAGLLNMLIVSYDDVMEDDFSQHSGSRIYQVVAELMDDEMVAEYLKGTYTLLPVTFWSGTLDSKWRGDLHLSLLASLHVDVEACVIKELEHLPGGSMAPDPGYGLQRRVILEKDEVQRLTLRWEWDYDPIAPGYHLVSYFNALAGDTFVSSHAAEWPFSSWFCWTLADEQQLKHRDIHSSRRFNRRTADKAHKERARTGQKQSRSKMPGAWD